MILCQNWQANLSFDDKILILFTTYHIFHVLMFICLFNTRDLIPILIFWKVKYYLYKFDEVSLFSVTIL